MLWMFLRGWLLLGLVCLIGLLLAARFSCEPDPDEVRE